MHKTRVATIAAKKLQGGAGEMLEWRRAGPKLNRGQQMSYKAGTRQQFPLGLRLPVRTMECRETSRKPSPVV